MLHSRRTFRPNRGRGKGPIESQGTFVETGFDNPSFDQLGTDQTLADMNRSFKPGPSSQFNTSEKGFNAQDKQFQQQEDQRKAQQEVIQQQQEADQKQQEAEQERLQKEADKVVDIDQNTDPIRNPSGVSYYTDPHQILVANKTSLTSDDATPGLVTQAFQPGISLSGNTVQQLSATSSLVGNLGASSQLGLTSVLPSVLTKPILDPIIEDTGAQFHHDLDEAKYDVFEGLEATHKTFLKPALVPLVIEDLAVKIGSELVLSTVAPSLIPLFSLTNSAMNKSSASDTLINLGESVPLAFTGVAGKVGTAAKVGTAGIIAAELGRDIAKDKNVGTVIANSAIRIIGELPGGKEGSKVAKAVIGAKLIAGAAGVIAPFTFDKEKKTDPIVNIVKETKYEDLLDSDKEIRDFLEIKNKPDKKYSFDALNIIQDHIDRTNFKANKHLKKQLDRHNLLNSNREKAIQRANAESTIVNNKNNKPPIDRIIKPTILSATPSQNYQSNAVEASYQPVSIVVPDYTGQVEVYKKGKPPEIKCTRLVGKDKKRCEKKKKEIEDANKIK